MRLTKRANIGAHRGAEQTKAGRRWQPAYPMDTSTARIWCVPAAAPGLPHTNCGDPA
jgi:hypothetical protein